MDYWQNIEQNIYSDLTWNIPEVKSGSLNIIGGNAQNFQPEIKIAEQIIQNFPFKTVKTILPDALKNKLPLLDNFIFLSSTESGSFRNGEELTNAIDAADFNLIFGDFSKNSLTQTALTQAIIKSSQPILITRDTIDFLAENIDAKLLERQNLFLLTTMAQFQKICKNSYYPRMILLSQPLTQVVETLHNFTLSYPLTLITFFNGKIIVANNSRVATIPLANTKYSPLSLWSGELATKIITANHFNPHKPFEASITATF